MKDFAARFGSPLTTNRPRGARQLEKASMAKPLRCSKVRIATRRELLHEDFRIPLAALLAAQVGHADVRATDDLQLQGLALCQDSWLPRKDDAKRMAGLDRCFETQFDRSSDAVAFPPKSPG